MRNGGSAHWPLSVFNAPAYHSVPEPPKMWGSEDRARSRLSAFDRRQLAFERQSTNLGPSRYAPSQASAESTDSNIQPKWRRRSAQKFAAAEVI
jgi:hypothetical protein